MKNVHLIYFSPAYSTRKIVRLIGESISQPFTEYDITQGLDSDLLFTENDFVVFAMPVYAGRIPHYATKYIEKVKGNNTLASVVCVYGNRDYDDALLELQDITEQNGFNVISGAAFIARHSIFPSVAENRPDAEDMEIIKEFAYKTNAILNEKEAEYNKIGIKGNRPYKVPGKIPFVPKVSKKCNSCGTCVKLCPAEAIPKENPKTTDKKLCVICARCINVCPQNARQFGGLIYKIANNQFRSKFANRREAELFF